MEENKLKELTRAEEEVMQALWKLKTAFAKDVLKELNDKRSETEHLAYNTVSTIIRILQEKGFVGHKAYGKTHEYFPLVEKSNYSNFFLNNFMGKYFGGSFQNMVSFFVKQNNVDLKEMEDLMKHIENEQEKSDENK
ncbi:MAG: BlaI/MecI/CopY family transcriptional regulator [Microscillaceae bacterium]|jgi:predicted transcriptional regulator|nr:BlaI/MecI/CopY family transcriptional regulator [Microscillaceae bacterium]